MGKVNFLGGKAGGLSQKATLFPVGSSTKNREKSSLIDVNIKPYNKPLSVSVTKRHSKIKTLEEEIKLLTSYGSDTVYRLRFDTMLYDYISPNVEKLLGFTADEIKRIEFRSLLVETRIITDGMKKIESFERLEEKRKSGDVGKWQADYLMRTKNGQRIWVSDVSQPWFDKNGKVIGSVGSLRDITDRILIESKVKEELQNLVNVDSLTGLPNRDVFFFELDRELRRIERSGSPVTILLADIDYLKKINDKYGNNTGDRLLVEVSGIIEKALRETDIVARIGGGEFAAILFDTSAKGAYWAAERIRLAVQQNKFSPGDDKAPLECSISLGVADAFPGQNKKSSDLYKAAGTRLYIAKNTGRNQISLDDMMRTH